MGAFDDILAEETPKATAPVAAKGAFDDIVGESAAKPQDDGDQVSRYASRIPPEDPNADQVSRARGKYPQPETPLFKDIAQRNDLYRLADYTASREAIRTDVAKRYRIDNGLEGKELSMTQMHEVERLTDEAFKQSKVKQPDQGFVEVAKEAFNAAATEPVLFAKEFVKETLANPQWLTPLTVEFGLANVVKGVGKAAAATRAVVRAGDAGLMGAGIGATSSAIRQKQEQGEVSGSQLANDAMMAGATTAVLQPVVAGAVMLGGKAVSLRNGTKLTPENVQKGVADATKAMEEGATPEAAVRQVLDEMKVPEAEAAAIEQAMKEAADATKAAEGGETPIKPRIKPKSTPDQIGEVREGDPLSEARTVTESEPQIKLEDREAGGEDITPSSTFLPDNADEATRIAITSRLKKIQDLLMKGDEESTLAARHEITKLLSEKRMANERAENVRDADRVRGVEWARERLNRAIRHEEISPETAQLALWLLDKAPHLADDAALTLKKMAPGSAGNYNPAQRLISLAKGLRDDGSWRGDSLTAAHEFMHHAERMMPGKIQQGIREEWARRVTDLQRWGQENDSEAARLAVSLIFRMNAGDVAAQRAFNRMLHAGILPEHAYELSNPSEFWAENAARILNDRKMAADHGWVRQAKQWTRELIEKIKEVAGLKSDAPVLRALKNVLEGTGEFRDFSVDDFISRMAAKYGHDAIFDRDGVYSKLKPDFEERLTPRERRELARITANSDRGERKMIFDDPKNTGFTKSREGVYPDVEAVKQDLSRGEISNVISQNQTGAIDKRLLAAMGLGSAGALATWIYTEDPLKAGLAGLTGAALTFATAKPVRSVLAAMGFHADQRWRVTDLTDRYSRMIAGGELAHQRMYRKLMKDLGPTSDGRLKVIRDWMEADPTTPQGQAFRQANPLSAREAAFVHAIEVGFDGGGQKLIAIGMDPTKLLENYVSHLWVPGLNKNKSILENLRAGFAERSNDISPGMSPHSRFSMRRSIPTYAEGERMGLMPVTNNPAQILQIYLNNVNKALANKQLQGALLRERTPWGERLMVVDMPEPALKEVLKRDAIAARQLQLDPADKKIFQDMHASIRAPASYVEIQHPQMKGFKVLRDIEAPLKHLFDANDPSVATKMAYNVSVAAKRALFSWSLFHAKSLFDALLGAGLKLPFKLAAARRALDDSGAAGDALMEGVKQGLRVTGRPIEGDITPFTNALKLLGEKYPVVGAPFKAVNFLTKKMDHFLWEFVHPTFKAAAFLAQFEKELTKRPNVPRAQVAKEVASYVNDVFGSVDWFRIADGVSNKYGRDLALAVTSPSGRRFMQIAMLAPDWTVATGRSLLKAVPGISSKEIAAMHRAYFVRSALLYATVADALNVAFSGHHFWENEDPTTVDLGDGRRLQLSKHFMEGIHWLTKPGQQALNKLGYVVSEPLKQAFNQEYLSTRGAPPIVKTNPSDSAGKQALDAAGQRTLHALKAPLPITLQNSITSTPGSVIAGFLGFPVLSKNEEQAVQAARERAEQQGKDVEKAEKRVRKSYQKKQEKQDALR